MFVRLQPCLIWALTALQSGLNMRGMRLLRPGLLLAIAACAPTNQPDELELTYYYLRF